MKKILIIEDQKVLREEVRDWFEFEGFMALAAQDGKEGIELALRHLPDLILCDIMMPEMDGNEVLRQLRMNQATSLIPFIFMTALSDRNQVRTGMEHGADDYITKPFHRNELLNAVSTRLSKADEIHERSSAALQELRYNLITSLPHELRTPLNGMLGFGQMLRDYPDSFKPEELPEIGERIYSSAMRLYRLIQNYLLYAQLELKRTGLVQKFELANAEDVITRAAKKAASSYKRKEDLVLDLSAGIPFIPELEMAKVIEELTDNAFKFSSAGTKVIVNSIVSNGKFRVSIIDEGYGIAAENLKKVGAFMQFERKSHEQQGFGLGLAISKKIIELFDGEIDIESEPGKGTTIRIFIPGR